MIDPEQERPIEPIDYARVGHRRPLQAADNPRILQSIVKVLAAIVLLPLVVGIVVAFILLVL